MQDFDSLHATYKACIAVGLLALIDYLLGVLDAAIKHKLASAKMYKGLLKKTAYFGLLFTAAILEYIMPYFGIEFKNSITITVAIMCSLIEVTSIIENACKLEPDLQKNDLMETFNIPEKTNEDTERNNNENDNARD